MTDFEISKFADSNTVVQEIIADLMTLISARNWLGSETHIALTGGRVGGAIASGLLAIDEIVNNQLLHIWWSDERYVPVGHPDRNDLVLPKLAESARVKIHAVPGPDTTESVEQAAQDYAKTLHLCTTTRFCADNTLMDVTILSIGPDGHVASLFPHSTQLSANSGTLAIKDSPKPPPVRVTWTYPTINASQEVWLVSCGAEKAPIVDALITGTTVTEIPASGAHGKQKTRLIIDDESGELLS